MTNQKLVVVWWWRGILNGIRGPFDTVQEAEDYKSKLASNYKDDSNFEVRVAAK